MRGRHLPVALGGARRRIFFLTMAGVNTLAIGLDYFYVS
jgi:hypothetical protein